MDPLTTSIAARVLAAAFLAVMMFSMGLELGGQPPKEKHVKRHERRLLLRALVVNLVVLPLLAFAVVHWLHRSGVVATAVLLVAATPGGRFAPRVAQLARGDLGLAVEITLFLAKLTAFTAPVTVKWLLGVPRVELRDLVLIAELLVLEMLPYLAGRWLRRKRPRAADPLRRPLFMVEMAIGVAVITYLVARGQLAQLRTVGSIDWGAGLLFALMSLGVGWLLGGPAPEVRRSFAVTAAARNLGLAFLIAGETFHGGAVQLAVLGIWLICLAVDMGFAAVVRAARPSPQPA